MADQPGIARPTLAYCEVGRLRLPVALAPPLAALFGVSADVLLGLADPQPGKRAPAPKLQLDRVSRLPKAQQHVTLAMLDGLLLQQP